MLLAISPNSLQSRRVNGEWTYFFCECEKALIPLLINPLTPPAKINFMLASLQHVDFYRQDKDAALDVLHRTLLRIYAEIREGEQELSGVSRSFRTPARWSQADQLPTTHAGLVQVHLSMPVDLYANWLHQASTHIRVLNTWTGIFIDHGDSILKAIQNGVRVQMLLLDPSSPFARQRSHDLSLARGDVVIDQEEVSKNIRTSIRQLVTFCLEPECDTSGLELRLYNAMPAVSMHQCDHHALVGFFPHSERTTTFPVLEIRTDSPFGTQIEAEFSHLWQVATPIDLSPQFAERVLAANQTLIEPLSTRELEILQLIASGLSNAEIAGNLVVTIATVKKHINSLYSKLQVTSRSRAIRRAHELNLL
jgi:DNA-binding CsgD family transcriptional regulator